MSGPKVVRIVTREEIEALCRRHLANVREAAHELRRCAKRCDVLDDRLQADIERRCATLERALAEERFGELQKQAPSVIGFFASEIDAIRARAVAAAEAFRSKRRRTAAAAATLIAAMESSGRPPSTALRDIVAQADFANDQQLAAMQSVLNRNYSSLVATPEPGVLSEAGKQLAHRLTEGEAPLTYADWLATRITSSDEQDARLDSLMAEIDILEDPNLAQAFLERAAAIKTETSAGRRALLTDSLVLDLSERSRRRKLEAALAERLRTLRVNLSTLNVAEARAMEAQITAMLDSSTYDVAETVLAQGTTLVDRETAKLAAAARRKAVLQGLARLGYEVHETMATAWARDGRIVIRKPGTTDYGVELGAPADLARLQVRLVGSDRPSQPRNAARDRDMETIWCSDFDRLHERLRQGGGEIIIERAIEAGAHPLANMTFDQPVAENTIVRRRESTRQR